MSPPRRRPAFDTFGQAVAPVRTRPYTVDMDETPTPPAPTPEQLEALFAEAKAAAEAVLKERAKTDPKAQAALEARDSPGRLPEA